MRQSDFIGAVQTAVDSHPKDGAKWRELEQLFADNGLRGNGAINNGEGADRKTRLRQLATSKKHKGHAVSAVSVHSVFVLGESSVRWYDQNKAKAEKLIETDLLSEHKDFESCLVLISRPKIGLQPLLLLRRADTDLTVPYETWWPSLPIVTLSKKEDEEEEKSKGASVSEGINLIFFGPPGTGKSTEVKKVTLGETIFRTQFHPEYSHTDLLGGYRPVVGYELGETTKILGHDGTEIQRPVNYFDFVPGPLVDALECAFASEANVFLIIEEINRGDCSAIFGEIFQLLDRNDEGLSEFGISLKPELLAFFNAKGVNYDTVGDGLLRFPPNFSLLATMNTSDQSLFPMDSAFKRRWEWKACPIDFDQIIEFTSPVRPFLDDGINKWDWVKLLEAINKNIVSDRMEDKQIGPWFIKPSKNGSVLWSTFLNKCLFYLWYDVFRDEQRSDLSPFKSDGSGVFSEVQIKIQKSGLAAGFKAEMLTEIGSTAMQISTSESTSGEPTAPQSEGVKE
jgi:hypothetical protein